MPVQVSEKERRGELDAAFRDVASIILEKCVNPQTSRPYTMGLIQRGLKDIHFAVDLKRSAKQQVRLRHSLVSTDLIDSDVQPVRPLAAAALAAEHIGLPASGCGMPWRPRHWGSGCAHVALLPPVSCIKQRAKVDRDLWRRAHNAQALEAIPRLEECFPIKRAMMRVAITLPDTCHDELAQALCGDDERFEQVC